MDAGDLYITCGVRGCLSNTNTSPELGLFRLPEDEERSTLWLKQLQQDDEPHFVCENHFEKRHVQCIVENNKTCKRLLTDALPTILSIADGTETAPGEPAVASNSSHVSETSTKRRLEEPNLEHHKQNKILRIQEYPQSLTVLLSEDDEDDQDETLLVKDGEFIPKCEYLNELNEKPQKQTYTVQFKMSALYLYFKYPLAYRVAHRSLNLPRISTLYRLCIPSTTELSPLVLNALKLKVHSMTAAEKQCVVCVGTLTLTPNIQYDPKTDKITGFHEVNTVHVLEPARTAFVVIVRGLFHNWKQAIAFAYSANIQSFAQTSPFIDDIIGQLFSIGLNVRALMSDLEGDKFTKVNERKLSAVKPFIVINNKQIYYMYDPLYLMKDLRDHWENHNFLFDDRLVAKWTYIDKMYQHDHKKELLRIAPNLTFNHIRPAKAALGELKLTADVFSMSTATALAFYIDMKLLNPAAWQTKQWIIIMNKLLQMLNFSTLYPPSDKTDVLSGDTIEMDYDLMSLYKLFLKLRLINSEQRVDIKKTKDAKFIEGFKMTIIAFLLLCKDLRAENLLYPVVGLTNDCLTEFFIKVRQKYDAYPTTEQMTTSIKTFPIFNIFQYNNKKRCSNDLEMLLLHLRQMPNINVYEPKRPKVDFVDLCDGASKDFGVMKLAIGQQLNYLASYLLNKGHEQHSDCQYMNKFTCVDDASKHNMLPSDDVTSGVRIGRSVPDVFIEFIRSLEAKFRDYFHQKYCTVSISGLLHFIQSVSFKMPCECFPLDYIKQLYLKFKLYLVIEQNNYLLRRRKSLQGFVIRDIK